MAENNAKSRSKLSNLRPSPDGPFPEACPAHAISKAGSNAHVIKQTCMKCGHRLSYPRPKENPKFDHATCEHRRTDNRGSTRVVHKAARFGVWTAVLSLANYPSTSTNSKETLPKRPKLLLSKPRTSREGFCRMFR